MNHKTLSRTGQTNLNYLESHLKQRLRSSGKSKSQDAHGNVIYIDTDIFDPGMLKDFLELSLSEFNQMPNFTNFSFEDTKFVNTFAAILVEGAVLYALSSQALIERGREFAVTNNGTSFDPPSISEMLNTQYSTILHQHLDKLKVIKLSIQKFKKE